VRQMDDCAQIPRLSARETLTAVVEGLIALRGPKSEQTLFAKEGLADILVKDGDLTEARALIEDVLQIRRRQLGSDHPHTLQSKVNLADVLTRQGELGKARRLLDAVLQEQISQFGENDSRTLDTQSSLAVILDRDPRLRDGTESFWTCATTNTCDSHSSVGDSCRIRTPQISSEKLPPRYSTGGNCLTPCRDEECHDDFSRTGCRSPASRRISLSCALSDSEEPSSCNDAQLTLRSSPLKLPPRLSMARVSVKPPADELESPQSPPPSCLLMTPPSSPKQERSSFLGAFRPSRIGGS